LLDRPAPEGARALALAALKALARARRKLGDRGDAAALHGFRVHLLKLRTALRAYRSVLGDSVPRGVRRRLSALADAAGMCRDAEVRLEWLRNVRDRGELADSPGIAWFERSLRRERRAADHSFHKQLRREFDAVTTRLRRRIKKHQAAHRDGEPRPVPATRALMARAIMAISGELRAHLATATKHAGARALHRTRMAVKRLRYLLEPVARGDFAPAPLAEAAGDAVAQLRMLQDELGRCNDAHEFSQWLRAQPKEARPPEGLRADAARLRRRLANETKAGYAIVTRPGSTVVHDCEAIAKMLRASAPQSLPPKSPGTRRAQAGRWRAPS